MKYLSPKQLGRAIGVSESSLKRWIDDGQISVTRTTGGHRRIELSEAVRFVRERGYTLADPGAIGLTAADEREGRADQAQFADRLHELMLGGSDRRFVAAAARLYLDGFGMAELIDGPLREAMRRIGELWHDNPDGVGVEHRATDICMRTIGYLHSLITPPAEDAPLAVGGAPPGDTHLLASQCVSLVLAEQGWQERNLGGDTPWDQFVSVARRERASLVWVSMTHEGVPGLTQRLGQMSQELEVFGCQLIVGGRAFAGVTVPRDRPNLHTAGSMAELVAFSRGVLSAQKTAPRDRSGPR